MIVWIICWVLFLLALAVHFGVGHLDPRIAIWSSLIGLGLLLLACRVKGL